MKNIKYLILSVLFTYSANAQVNLVLNPSFEMDTCIGYWTGAGEVFQFVPNWDSLRNGGGGTPDIFNPCYSHINKRYDVPENYWGFQYPKNSLSYAAVLMSGNNVSIVQNREYIQGTLVNLLTQGHSYCVRLNISLSNRSKYSCISVGAYLDNGSIQSSSATVPYPYIMPQIINTQGQLNDTLNWKLIEGNFIANGTEEYITIGNFAPDSLSGIVQSYPSAAFNGSYYYIDDISVIDISTPAYAGNDTLLLVSDTVYLGRPSEIGLDEACIWFFDGVPIDTAAGIWVVPDSTTTYILQQTLCGNVQYDTVTVTVDTGTGMERIRGGEIKIFPNPSSGEVWYHLAEEGKASLEIYSIDGKLLHQEMVSNRFKNNQIDYDFDRGVYVVVIRLDGRISREKVVVR